MEKKSSLEAIVSIAGRFLNKHNKTTDNTMPGWSMDLARCVFACTSYKPYLTT